MKTPGRFHRVVTFAFAAVFAAATGWAETRLAHWPFTDGSLEDASGNGYSLTSGASVVTSDGYLHFPENAAEGTSWAQTTNKVTMNGAKTASVSLWLRKPNPANGTTLMELTDMSATGVSKEGTFSLDYTADKKVSLTYYANQSAYKNTRVSSAGLFDDDEWHFVTATINITSANANPSVNLYVDGKLNSTATASAKTKKTSSDTFKNDRFYFARRKGDVGTGGSFAGDMGEIAVYGVALSAANVLTNYYRELSIVYHDDETKYGSFLPPRWRSVGGNIVYRVRVISNRDVSCDGRVALRGTNDYWITEGTLCTLKASPVAVDERLGWCGVPTGGTFDDLTQTATFTVSRPTTIRVEHFRPTHIWTGEADTDFFNATNWVNTSGIVTETAPAGDATVVYVPTECARYPTAASAVSVGDFRIGSLTNGAGWATFTAKTLQTNVVAGSCVVYSGGRLLHAENDTEKYYVLNVDVGGDMMVAAGGEVSVTGKGYSAGKGPGGRKNYLTGGTYAGNAYNRSDGQYPPYYYGSSRRPTDLGSGGQGGRGGGCVRLDVAGALIAEGTFIASGGPGAGSGSGSGGSIWVLANALEGYGKFFAESGSGYGASGGRIAVCQRTAADMSAFCGTFGYGNGTLYEENALDEPGRGELKIAKPTSGNTDATVLDVTVDDASEPYGRVTVASGGKLSVRKGVTLRATQGVAAVGTLVSSAAGGGLELMPPAGGEATVQGALTFHTVIATNGDSTVRFADGAKVTVHNDGAVWLGGNDGRLTTFMAPSSWELSIGERVDAVIQYVAASNSNASAAKVSDIGGRDLGGNVNWEFPRAPEPGDTITWTGNGTADWGVADNWTDRFGDHRLPLETDRIFIGADAAPYPVVTASKSAMSFAVAEGAEFTLNGADLTVAEYLACTGTLTCCGSETISVGGAISLAGGTFVRGTSTVVLAGPGAAAQSADFTGCELYNLVVQTPAASFARGFSAYAFTCEQAGSAALVFGAGELFDFTKLRLVPAVGASLTLDSTVTGSAWRLKAGAGALCDGVSVRDCDASPGNAICTRGFIDRTNNTNWRSGAVRWLGNGTAWADEANWEGGVPTNTSDVLIGPSANNPVLGKATSIRSLTVNGDGASVQLKLSAELSVSEFAYVGQGATVVADHPMSVTNDFLIAAGGKLTHTQGSGKVDLFVGGGMTIDVGGSVDVTSCGYTAGQGPGGNGEYLCTGTYGGGGRGAKPCYGSIRRPVDYGSGGQSYGGGGAVRLTVGNDLVVNGSVIADSNPAGGNGTGSGGSVWLTAGALKGGSAGVISARSAAVGYAGGGGRISLVQTKATDLSAYKGTVSSGSINADSGPGTLYVENADDEPDCGELIADGCGKSPVNACELGTSVTDAGMPFRKITVKNTGLLTISAGAVVRTLDLEVPAGCTLNGAGTLELTAGSGRVSHVDGSFTLGGLICTNAGAQVEVAAGVTLALSPGGYFWLSGEEGNLLRVISPDVWNIDYPETVDAKVRFVAASNSVSAISISDVGGEDLGGNENWSFPPMPKDGARLCWAGGGSTEWAVADNWLDEQGNHRPPLVTDVIVIGSDRAPYPVVAADQVMRGLFVAAGASVVLSGGGLTIAGELSCTGRLACAGAELVTVSGDVEFPNGGTFEAGISTFVLSGAERQSVDFAANAFYNVRVECSEVAFATGFSAYSFTCEQSRGTALVFGAGELFDFTKLRLVPAAGASLTLDSTVMDAAWRLKAGAGALCDGVSVRDCDASSGNAICTIGYIDRTNNTNWRSGAVRWLGKGTAWADEANWEGGVPTNTSDVLIGPSANNPVLGKATGVRSLTVNGDGASVQLKLNAELSVSEFAYVGQGATVVADHPMSVTNDFLIAAGGKITHTQGSGKVELFVGGSMTIDVGGSVDVDMRGYAAGKGPGGNGAYLCTGSYGGRGTGGKPCYGSIRRPVDYGSGGQSNGGGGAVRLTVENDLVVNGGITARSYQDTGNGTGSGGSIWMTVGKLLGGAAGVISAKSAEGKYPGGGGRISLVQTKATDISAYEGLISAGAVSAGVGPGTLYVENADDEPDCGELIVDGCDKSPTLPCELGTSVTDATVPFKKITVRNTGRLTMSGGVLARTLGDFEAAGCTVTAAVPSGLEILPRREAVAKVSGSIAVGAFVCTNGAGTVEFAKGTRVTVAENGLLNLNGQVDRGLRLKSSEDGQPWYLTVGIGSTIVAKCLDVSDSDASEGEEIAARRSVGKRARNVHWKFKSGMALIVR